MSSTISATQPAVNLYAHPISPYSQKVHFLLEESGRPFKYTIVDLGKGEQYQAAYKRINSLSQVPALAIGDFSLSESNAISRYLALKWEMYDWYPVNLEERATVDRFAEFTTLSVGRYLLSLAWNFHFAPLFGLKGSEPMIEEAYAQLAKSMPKLEAHLYGRQYLAGVTPTLADAAFLPFAAAHKVGRFSLSDFPSVDAWLSRMSGRPAWKKVEAKLSEALRR